MSLSKILQLRPVEFNYTKEDYGDTNSKTLGLLSEDVKSIYPYREYSIIKKNSEGLELVDYTQLIAPMIKAIHELSDKVDDLQKQLDK